MPAAQSGQCGHRGFMMLTPSGRAGGVFKISCWFFCVRHLPRFAGHQVCVCRYASEGNVDLAEMKIWDVVRGMEKECWVSRISGLQ